MTAGVERVLDEHGRIDVLVNNAGYGSYGAVEDVPIDEARRQFEVNVFGLARLTQLVTPAHARGGDTLAQRRGSSTSPRSAASSTSRWARGTTPRSSRWRASATACASSWRRSASTSSSSSPGRSAPSGTRSPARASLETSRGGAYEEQAEQVRRVHGARGRRLMSSGPDAVAKKMVQAVASNTPRARYPVGRGAGTIVRARKLLPDAAFDYVVKADVRPRGRSQAHRPVTARPPRPSPAPSSSSSRWVSSRCRCGHGPAAAGQAEAHVAVVRRAGDVERHPVDRDRQRVGAEQLGAVPVVGGARARARC